MTQIGKHWSYFHIPVPSDLTTPGLWKGLASIGVALPVRVHDGKETVGTRSSISRPPVGAKRFAHAVRSHWGIENGCHWALDTTFREHGPRIRDRHLRENCAWLDRLALSLLKQHPGKGSTAMKCCSCRWDGSYLLEVLCVPEKRVSDRSPCLPRCVYYVAAL